MKTSQHFQEVIKNYLERRAQDDEFFATRYRSTTRTIEDVCTFIINQVKAMGVCGVDDDTVFSLAVHCIDEPQLEIGDPTPCKVVVNTAIELTEEEIAEAKQKAMLNVMKEQENKLRKPSTKKPLEAPKVETASLFDF